MKRLLFLPLGLLGVFLSLIFIFSPKHAFASEWVNVGFSDKIIKTVFVNPENKEYILTSTQTNSYYSENGGGTWNELGIPGCYNFAQNPSVKNEFWAACFPGIYHSVDGGRSFTKSPYYSGSNVTEIAINSHGTIYISGTNVGQYRSYDGLIWQYVGTGLSGPSIGGFFVDLITDAVYITGFPGLYKSTDDGSHWSLVSSIRVTSMFSTGEVLCGVANVLSFVCSSNSGYAWSSDSALPVRDNYHAYSAAANPDVEGNLIVARRPYLMPNPADTTIYSKKAGETFWSSEVSPYKFNYLRVSQGTIFAFSNEDKNGLWRNDGIAVKPEYLEKYPVIIVPGILGSWEKDGKWEIDPLFHTYDNLISSIESSGYVINKELFTFPYEWRNDNNYNATLLKRKIEEVKQISGKPKVVIIAHSMGGLITRSYAESDDYQGDIFKIIFLGTPHIGSPKSYPVWEAGDIKFGYDILRGVIINFVFNEEAKLNGYSGDTGLFDYIRNRIISVKQLLPIFNYLKINNELTNYPAFYPRNVFLENLEKNKNRLVENGIKIVDIIGDNGEKTVSFFDVIRPSGTFPFWEEGIPENYYLSSDSIHYSFGDDTVLSNYSLNIGEKTLSVNSPHVNLPTASIKEILDELNANIPEIPIVHNINSLIIVAHSPVDFYVQAPNGQRIGLNKETGGEFTESEDAFYSGNNPKQPEFLVIRNPQEGEYKVVTIGTGEGKYGIEAVYVNEVTNQQLTTLYEGTTRTGLETKIDVNLDLHIGEITSEIEDVTSPEISLKINNLYNHWDTLDINAGAIDNESGVDYIKVFLDGKEIGNNLNFDLFGVNYGNHEIKVVACDKAGNISEITKGFLLYTDLNKTQKDLDYLFKRDEFKSYGVMIRFYVKFESLKYKSESQFNDVYNNILKQLDKELKNKQISNFAYNLIKNDISFLIGG